MANPKYFRANQAEQPVSCDSFKTFLMTERAPGSSCALKIAFARSGLGCNKGSDPPLQVVGTRSRASRGGTSSEARNGSLGGKRKQASETCRPGSRGSASLPRATADHVSIPRAIPDRAKACLLPNENNLTLRLRSTACFFNADGERLRGLDGSRRMETRTDESVIGN